MKFNKLVSLLLTVSVLAATFSASIVSAEPSEAPENFRDYAAYGRQISNSLSAVAWQENNLRAYDNVAGKSGDSFLWGYGSYIEGLGARVAYDPLDGEAVAEYKKAMYNVLRYEATNLYSKYDVAKEDYLALNCLPDNVNTEVFYDDCIWIQKEFLNAYNIFGDDEYLDLARRVMNYIYLGWDDKFGGGIYWKDTGYGGTSGKNTCINAPAAMASCQMYVVTGDVSYLDWAIKIYDWMKDKFVDPEDKLLWDNVDYNSEGEERIDKAKYTYNSGCFISAAAMLYEITGQAVYLEDAKATAESATARWLHYENIDGLYSGYIWSSGHTWFNSSLVEGFLNLKKVDADETYVNVCLNSLAVACLSRADSAEGWMHDNWRSTDPVGIENVSLLQQSATVRTLFMLAEYADERAEPAEKIAEIANYPSGSAEYTDAVYSAVEAYFGATYQTRMNTAGFDALYSGMVNCLGSDGAAEVKGMIEDIYGVYALTYKTEEMLNALAARYGSLTELQQRFVVNRNLLTEFFEYQQEIFDSFEVEVTGWADADNTPWLAFAADEEKQVTRAAAADEMWFQYRHNYYNMGYTRGSFGFGSYTGVMGIQIDRQPNDNIYNPWGHEGRRWAYVTVPFSEMAFSITGYFANSHTMPIGNSFTYNGNVYQAVWDNIRYYPETPLAVGTTVEIANLDFYPGSDGTNDVTANTFRYSYAWFGQENKWQDGTLGIPTGGAQRLDSMVYQKYEGPDGFSYLVNTDARVAAVSQTDVSAAEYEDTLQMNAAFIITGALAEQFIALGDSGESRFAVTGAPIAMESGGIILFENGILTSAGFDSDSDFHEQVAEVNASIAQVPPIAAITLEDKPVIVAARQNYDSLPAWYQSYVDGYDRLCEAEDRIAQIEQEIIDRASAAECDRIILALGQIGYDSRSAVEAARSAFDGLNTAAQGFVSEYELLAAAENTIKELFDGIDFVNSGIAALPNEITYKDGGLVREIAAVYGGLTDRQKGFVNGYESVLAAENRLSEIYDDFGVTVSGWSAVENMPWMAEADEEMKETTRAAIADEIKHQYVENCYNVGVKNGADLNISNYSGMIGVQTEARPNDNPGNPWGHNRYWAFVSTPFAGMSFSVCGYFSRHYNYSRPIGNAFEYNGIVYQQYWNSLSYYSYQPIEKDQTVSMQSIRSFPGYDGNEDITAGTFRYAYAQYAQDNKWSGGTLGIPSENAVVTETAAYQRFEGPGGSAVLFNTIERISASNDQSQVMMSDNSAYALNGALADAFMSLGEDPIAVLGLPLGEIGETYYKFENGVLGADGFVPNEQLDESLLDNLVLKISDGMVTESKTPGLVNITWNCTVDIGINTPESIDSFNRLGVNFLSYGVYYGISEQAIESLMNGDLDATAKQLIFDTLENYDDGRTGIPVYTRYGFRINCVSEGRVRSALFYLVYEYEGRVVTLLSAADTTTAWIL